IYTRGDTTFRPDGTSSVAWRMRSTDLMPLGSIAIPCAASGAAITTLMQQEHPPIKEPPAKRPPEKDPPRKEPLRREPLIPEPPIKEPPDQPPAEEPPPGEPPIKEPQT